VCGYNAPDDANYVKGAFEMEKLWKVAACCVQERVLFSDSFDQTIASCSSAESGPAEAYGERGGGEAVAGEEASV
jgi:hypothetical protein